MLDEEHEPLSQSPRDCNVYKLGRIFKHDVDIAGLHSAGNTSAATVVGQMTITFPNLLFGLLVGIGGGVPCRTESGWIRLGHVVVGKPTGVDSGAIHYDHGKALATGIFERVGFLAAPPPALLNAAQALDVHRIMADIDPVRTNLARIPVAQPRLRRFACPGAVNDRLYEPNYVHLQPGTPCQECGCDANRQILLPGIDGEDDEDGSGGRFIVVHRGTIASGGQVVRDAILRDQLAKQYKVHCFEMEAAGAMHSFPCLVVRGISDYCDSHKNDQWQGFAAATAAAYARQIFFHLPFDIDVRDSFPLEEADWAKEKKSIEGPIRTPISETPEVLKEVLSSMQPPGAGAGAATAYEPAAKGAEVIPTVRKVVMDRPPQTLVNINGNTDRVIWLALYQEGRYVEAESLARDVQRRRVIQLGPDHESTLDAQNLLGVACYRQAKLEEALCWFRRTSTALGHAQGNGQHDQKVMYTLYWCGRALYDQGRFREAEKDLIRVAESGKEYEWTTLAVSYLAEALFKQEMFARCERLCRDVLKREMDKEEADRDIPLTVWIKRLLGDTFRHLGRLHESEITLRNGLETSREKFGDRHELTLRILNSLGSCLIDLGNFREAEGLIRTAMEGYLATLGQHNPLTLSAFFNLGLALGQLRRHGEAVSVFRTAADGHLATWGANHEYTLTSSHALGVALIHVDRFEEAAAILVKLALAYSVTLGLNNKLTLMSGFQLGLALQGLHHHEDAARVLERVVLQGSRGKLGYTLTSVQLSEAQHALGTSLLKLNRPNEAEQTFRAVAKARARALGGGHEDTLQANQSLCRALMAQYRYIDAEKVCRDAVKMGLEISREGTPWTLHCMFDLSRVLLIQDINEEAEEVADRVLAGRTEIYGHNHKETLDVLRLKSEIAYSRGGLRKAERLLKEVAWRRRMRLGEEDERGMFQTLDLLGRVLYDQLKYKEAEEIFLELLRKLEQHPREDGLQSRIRKWHCKARRGVRGV